MRADNLVWCCGGLVALGGLTNEIIAMGGVWVIGDNYGPDHPGKTGKLNGKLWFGTEEKYGKGHKAVPCADVENFSLVHGGRLEYVLGLRGGLRCVHAGRRVVLFPGQHIDLMPGKEREWRRLPGATTLPHGVTICRFFCDLERDFGTGNGNAYTYRFLDFTHADGETSALMASYLTDPLDDDKRWRFVYVVDGSVTYLYDGGVLHTGSSNFAYIRRDFPVTGSALVERNSRVVLVCY